MDRVKRTIVEDDFYSLDLSTRKLCSDAVKDDAKAKIMLVEFFESLNDAEKRRFEQQSQEFYYVTKLGAKRFKISQNAIRIAIRLKEELQIACYPMIEKIATRGWSTSGGSFAWSMKRLDGCGFYNEVHCCDPAEMLTRKKYKLSVRQSNNFTVLSAD